MRDDFRVPDFTFPSATYGKYETPWDLKVLLYLGGAKANPRHVGDLLTSGRLGDPLLERFDLVQKIHEAINGKLVGGGSHRSACTRVELIRRFFTWAEQANQPLTLDTIQTTYLHWTDWLMHRQRVVGDIKARAAYSQGVALSVILGEVLNRPNPLIKLTRLVNPPKRKTARGTQAEKQNLQDTFEFGHLLQDICDRLPVDVVLKGPLPVRFPLRGGGQVVAWSGWTRPTGEGEQKVPKLDTPQRRYKARMAAASWDAWVADGTLRTRYPLANLRCEAELLMFIGQTGMNMSQAHQLKLRDFFYASHLDGYQVKDRKGRRGGEVLFEVFKDYKPHFERYLAWRRQLFPNSEILFPFVRQKGRAEHTAPRFNRIREICKQLGLCFVSPSKLRNTRVNWLLRRSGDADQTAEMAQHTKETLLNVYARPSQQRAMGEVMRFWAKNDPALSRTVPAAPGECDGQPVPIKGIPIDAPQPDCVQPSGCLWCEHHRDIDSQDYVWSLGCFRHLKIIELSKWHPPQSSRETHPGEGVINRISEKMRWFKESNARRRSWVEEALARVEEGTYHPSWQRLIEGMEGTA